MSIDGDSYENIIKRASLVYDQQAIDAMFDRMAKEIDTKLGNKLPLFLCVMRGALIVMGQLMARLDFPLQVDFLQLSCFQGGAKRLQLAWQVKPSLPLQNRHVVIVEDILDSGQTLMAIKKYCLNQGAKQVYMAALMSKHHKRSPDAITSLDFCSLSVPNKFLIGYGLDYQEFFRNAPGIYVMADEDTPEK